MSFVPPPKVDHWPVDDFLDDPGLNAVAMQMIGELPAWITPIQQRIQQLPPLPGSRFEDDDAMKRVDLPSQQVVNLLRSAHDHLQFLADAIPSPKGVRPLASFTLLRSTIEASALAIWLMIPGTRDKRLSNSIRLSLDNRRSTETYNRRFEVDTKTVGAWFDAEMRATADGRPGTRGMDFDRPFPTVTSILLETVRAQTKVAGPTGLDAWRACSGIAHSNAQFAGAATVATERENEIAVSARPSMLWLMLEPTKRYLEFALFLAERHMAPTPARPSKRL